MSHSHSYWEEISAEGRIPDTSKITLKSKINNKFIKASYNLLSHDINLYGFEESSPANLWHEMTHKVLWEEKDIPDNASEAWDNIAYDLQEYLSLGKEPFDMNYKTIESMRNELKVKK